jgi:hypothetical protein
MTDEEKPQEPQPVPEIKLHHGLYPYGHNFPSAKSHASFA